MGFGGGRVTVRVRVRVMVKCRVMGWPCPYLPCSTEDGTVESSVATFSGEANASVTHTGVQCSAGCLVSRGQGFVRVRLEEGLR